MSRRTLALVVLGVVAYVVFLAATVPASFVAGQLRIPGLAVSDANGTLWAGNARAAMRTPQGSIDLDRIEWSLRPLRLIAGRLAFDLRGVLKGVDAKARLERGFSTTELRDLEAQGDAAAMALFAPLVATWQPQGNLTATAPLLSWDGVELRGEGRAEWRGATMALSQVRPLGSYRAELKAAGGPAKIIVTTLEGPLRLTGDGTLTPQGRFAFTGEARGEGPSAPALEPLLNLMGPRRPDGSRALRWSQ